MDKILDYLRDAKLMQVATVSNGGPWICTVYFVADDNLNLYWLSLPTRRHSQDIAVDNNVAIAIAIKPDLPVIGIQAEGAVAIVSEAKIVEKVMVQYVEKYNSGKDFYKNFIEGTNQHQMYKFTADSMILFDEKSFPDNPRQIVAIK